MWCGTPEVTGMGIVCFVVINPLLCWFGLFFLLHTFLFFPSPPPPRLTTIPLHKKLPFQKQKSLKPPTKNSRPSCLLWVWKSKAHSFMMLISFFILGLCLSVLTFNTQDWWPPPHTGWNHQRRTGGLCFWDFDGTRRAWTRTEQGGTQLKRS